MPWEETDEYIRSGHRDSSGFQEGSFRTITIDADKGIKAVIGKPKGQDTTEVQSYLFDKDKWTLEEAKAWFQEHKSETLKIHCDLPLSLQFLTEKADPDTKIFPWSMPARYYMKPGRLIIYGTALVAGQTRKGDIYTKKELERHGCTLIGGPIELFEHTWDVGEDRWLPYPANAILDAEEVDGMLEYIAGIDDSLVDFKGQKLNVQELIRQGEIPYVSVNALCRFVPPDNPGQCNGMLLNGFCLLHKDSIPSSTGTSVKVWNSFRADALRLKSVGKPPCFSESEKGVTKSKSEKDKKIEPPKKTETDWDTEYINNLPDDAFAYIEDSGTKDEQGKTTPRSLRHLPFKNAQGEIDHDHDHLVAALQALGGARQGEAPPYADKAKPKLCAAVKAWNESHQDNPIQSDVCDVQPKTASEPFKPYKEKFVASFIAAKNKTAQMSVDEIKARIAELSKQREALWDKLYPPPEQLVSEEERINLQSQIDVIIAEMEALEMALAEKIAAEPSGGQPATVIAAVKPVENEPVMVVVTEQEIFNVLKDRRRFTPALQVNGILDLLEQKRKEIEK